MMDWTDRHCRFFHRQLSLHARLYTEMIHTGAIVRGDASRHLRLNAAEHPLALQLGGSNPYDLALATEAAMGYQYDEVNLNCGCPSDRVQEGQFGACLMAHPQQVRDCVRAMSSVSTVPVTVKCRIGIDDSDGYAFLHRFVMTVAEGGCKVFVVHARKAWLSGLSPKENRDIPPLDYEMVYRLKQAEPELTIVLNGGIETLEQGAAHLQSVDGVMIGRAAYENPYLLVDVDPRMFASTSNRPSRQQVIARMRPYIEQELTAGTKLSHITRHILGLFRHQPGGKAFRRRLTELSAKPGADWLAVEAALAELPDPPQVFADAA